MKKEEGKAQPNKREREREREREKELCEENTFHKESECQALQSVL